MVNELALLGKRGAPRDTGDITVAAEAVACENDEVGAVGVPKPEEENCCTPLPFFEGGGGRGALCEVLPFFAIPRLGGGGGGGGGIEVVCAFERNEKERETEKRCLLHQYSGKYTIAILGGRKYSKESTEEG